MIVRIDQDYTGPVHIEAVGDNSGGDSLALGGARSNGQVLQTEGDRVDNVKLAQAFQQN